MKVIISGDVSELDFLDAAGHQLLRWVQRKVIHFCNFASRLEKIPNCVLLNSIWQPGDLDRRKRITVWNELHATLTYPRSSPESEQDDETRQFRRGRHGLGYADYSASSRSMHRASTLPLSTGRSMWEDIITSCLQSCLSPHPVSVQTPSYLKGMGRGEPEQGQQPRTASFPPATETDRTWR